VGGISPLRERAPAKILADLGAVLNWPPADVRRADPDPEKLWIQVMKKGLALAGGRRFRGTIDRGYLKENLEGVAGRPCGSAGHDGSRIPRV